MTYSKFFINGKEAGEHKGGFTPFSLEVTEHVKNNNENVLVVKVDSKERPDIPPFGSVLDYLAYGGIYREVKIQITDKAYIKNVLITPQKVLSKTPSVKYKVKVDSKYKNEKNAILQIKIQKGKKVIASKKHKVSLNANKNTEFEFTIKNVKNAKLWDIDNPNLYQFKVQLLNESSQKLDHFETRFGFRKAEFTPKGFYLNGKRVEIRGLNRHQSYPYVGYAMPKRAQEKDAEILKNELHVNLVRTSHYLQSKHFLNKCDELGLLVFEEIPGWQHIGDKKWQEVSIKNVEEMISRDYNHPSIILWGVRINESLDNDEFYKKTNDLAHKLDSTRQTGGVRSIFRIARSFLEDVFTINDFIFEGKRPILSDPKSATGQSKDVPYLISEYCGHLYPTKKYDHEGRLEEHANRHAKVLNSAALNKKISGAIGWCAFDYNTHNYFGSGDRICYHGIMDMFRLPKFAAYVYKSQVNPKIEPVLEPLTIWSTGERNIWDYGVVDLFVYTNCDEIRLFLDGKKVASFKGAKERFRGLKYPPVIIENMQKHWRENWGNGKFEGYVNGKKVVEKKFVKDPIASKLEIIPDNKSINADGIDVTRIVVRIVDQVDNPLIHTSDCIKLDIKGPGEIIGPRTLPLIGGSTAFWIKSKRKKGKISISVKSERLGERKVKIIGK